MSHKRIFYWDNLKFLLIYCVVIGHALELYPDSGFVKYIVFFIYSFHMPLFVFCSGIFSKSIINKKRFKIEKVFSYLILYILLKLSFFILNKFVFGYDSTFNFFVEGGVPWYLFAVAMFLGIMNCFKNIKFSYVFVGTLIASLLVGFNSEVGDFLVLSRIFYFFPFFVLGYFTNMELIEKIISKRKVKYFSIVFLVVVSSLIMFNIDDIYPIKMWFSGRNSYDVLGYPIAGFIFRGVVYLYTTIVSFSVLAIIPKKKLIVTELGKGTIQVYFLHYLVLFVYQYLAINAYLGSVFPHIWIVIYILFFTFVTIFLSFPVIGIPFRKILSLKFTKIMNEK